MSYSGTLASSPGDPGVRAGFQFHTGRVVIECATDTFEWTLDEMRIAPWDTTTVRLRLPDGELFFRADDPLRFSDAVEDASDPYPGRRLGWLNSIFSSPTSARRPAGAPAAEQPPDSNLGRLTAATVTEPTLTERAAAIDLEDPLQMPSQPPTADRPWSERLRGRLRFRRSPEHTHRWETDPLNGGLIRRVCQDCHHVSIELASRERIPAR